jgi:hypothetical protein
MQRAVRRGFRVSRIYRGTQAHFLLARTMATKNIKSSGGDFGWPCLPASSIFRCLKFQTKPVARIFEILFSVAFIHATAMADNQVALANTNPSVEPDARFGLFNWLDHRSAYYQDFFPTPLLLDETSLEPDGEFELNSLHTQANAQHSDLITAEVEKSFGLLTLELDVPYERNSDSDDVSQGIGNVELGARYPLYQFVSANGLFDTTLGVAMQVGIPVNSAVSQNTELDPTVFNDLKLGENFSIQSVFGYSTLFGGGDNGGLQTFEYGFDFGYSIPHSAMALPGINQFTPMFELTGETQLNQADSGQNSLLGSIGFRLDLKPIGDLQPGLGLGLVFPMDNGASAEVHWGIAASLTLEF